MSLCRKLRRFFHLSVWSYLTLEHSIYIFTIHTTSWRYLLWILFIEYHFLQLIFPKQQYIFAALTCAVPLRFQTMLFLSIANHYAYVDFFLFPLQSFGELTVVWFHSTMDHFLCKYSLLTKFLHNECVWVHAFFGISTVVAVHDFFVFFFLGRRHAMATHFSFCSPSLWYTHFFVCLCAFQPPEISYLFVVCACHLELFFSRLEAAFSMFFSLENVRANDRY